MSAPFFEFRAAEPARTPSIIYAGTVKRGLDLLFVVAILPVVLPLVAALALCIVLAGGRPLYSQARVGRGGRIFRRWKLRTMVPDADAELQRLLATDPRIAAEWARYQKISRDPRITRIGRFLRKTNLDELPQIWNVLCGHMSLVGPRPFTPDQARLYMAGRTDVAYYRLRPGITGLWQVGHRNSSGFGERALADHDYAGSLSLRTDIAILLRTVGVVLRGTGV